METIIGTIVFLFFGVPFLCHMAMLAFAAIAILIEVIIEGIRSVFK